MNRIWTLFLTMMLFFRVVADVSSAAEVVFPVESYSGQKLAEIRQWEQTWAGKTVSKDNIDQIREYVPVGVYTAIKNPDWFNVPKLWFTVVPYRPYRLSKGMIAATKRHAPEAALDADGNLSTYGTGAGIPFPQPKNGTEVAWNFHGNTMGDSHREFHTGPVVDCRTGFERVAGHNRWDLHWIGRYDVAPMPNIPAAQNPRGIARTFFQRHVAPADFVDTTILEVKYIDLLRSTDMWVYTAMFRRVRRYATNQRTDMIDGTDMIYDDQDGWYTHLARNTYRLIGRRDLLVCRHQDMGALERTAGQGYWNGMQRELVDNWIVEVVSKDPNYLYSKQKWYIDPETWQMNLKEMYNREGKLWKMYEFCYNEHPSADNGTTSIYNAEHIVDFIRQHGSLATRTMQGIGIDIPLDLFRVRSMRKRSY